MLSNMKKITTIFALIFVLSFTLVSISEIGIVKAEDIIYIRADGTVEGTDKIQQEGNVYTLTGNIYDPIVVEKDDIIVDGGNYTLQGTGTGHGIELSDRKNVKVKNFEINQFEIGISIYDYSEPRNNTLSANIITNNTYGIYIEHSHNNTIFGNSIMNNEYGIHFLESRFNMLRNNSLSNNHYSFDIHNTNFVNDVDTSNLVDGKPMIYWVNQQNRTVPSEAGYVALINCRYITIRNLTLDNNGQGILLASTTDSTIANNTITKNKNGLWLYDSPNNTISWNIITNNDWGIRIQGTYPTYAPNNKVCGNTIENNNEYGIIIIDSVDNSIYGNNITNNECGIHIPGFMEITNNIIHHNNFINNTEQASVPGWWHMIVFEEHWVPPPSNFWDDGKEGNYWSNYLTRYPNATETDSFIWSTPYNISDNNQDNYPLTAPIYLFDAGTWEWTQYNVYVVSNSTVSDFSFNPDEGALLRFDVEGEDGTTGFCRVIIPKNLLDTEGNWVVIVDVNSVTPTVNEDANNTYLYFTYQHSTKTVEIIGTTAIPEFPSWIILPLLITATLLIIICKQRLPKTSN